MTPAPGDDYRMMSYVDDLGFAYKRVADARQKSDVFDQRVVDLAVERVARLVRSLAMIRGTSTADVLTWKWSLWSCRTARAGFRVYQRLAPQPAVDQLAELVDS